MASKTPLLLEIPQPVDSSWRLPAKRYPGRRGLDGRYRSEALELVREDHGRPPNPLEDIDGWLEALYLRALSGQTGPAVGQIIDAIEELFARQEIRRCDTLLERVDVSRFDTVEPLLAFLMATGRAKEQFISRERLRMNIVNRVQALLPERAQQLLAYVK
ncbi:hypothetical protein [Myxococcus eversor]|uniref:hypothetical protein n=1 Tax=Myxococcus eversor TaxID=2709661 RepID=UPI0013D6D529|nr:hypothetical protein [Myxococcus eversor]